MTAARPQLSPGLTRTFGASTLELDRFRRWLARQPEPFRAGFWACALLVDGGISRHQMLSGGYVPPVARGVDAPSPEARPTVCSDCGSPLPSPKATGRPRTRCSRCKRAASAAAARARDAAPGDPAHLALVSPMHETPKLPDEAQAL